MANSVLDAGFRRREMLRFAAMTGVAMWAESYALAADFWNKQKPAEWTDQQKEELRTKSPWAKKVDGEMGGGSAAAPGSVGGGDSGGGGGRGGGGGGGGRGGGGGGGGAPGGGGGGGQAPSLEIFWMSAKPIQDAHPLALGAKLENHYVIAVTGIPMQILNAVMMGRGGGRGNGAGRGRGDQANTDNAAPPAAPPDPTAGLKRGATLMVKGKDPANCDVVMSMNSNVTVLFGFSRESLALTVADKEVEFDLKLGSMSAKGKFTLKDMMYNGELAL